MTAWFCFNSPSSCTLLGFEISMSEFDVGTLSSLFLWLFAFRDDLFPALVCMSEVALINHSTFLILFLFLFGFVIVGMLFVVIPLRKGFLGDKFFV